MDLFSFLCTAKKINLRVHLYVVAQNPIISNPDVLRGAAQFLRIGACLQPYT